MFLDLRQSIYQDIKDNKSDEIQKFIYLSLNSVFANQIAKNGILAPFIVLEGVNGSGKSTLISKLDIFLKQLNIPFEITKEPGGTELGKKIRSLVLNQEKYVLEPKTEALLFSADRAEHILKKILPNLQRGITVVSDRFYMSYLAFQGAGRVLEIDKLKLINSFVLEDLLPTLTIILDLDPIVGLNRNINETTIRENDSMEKENAHFHERVRNSYLQMAKDSREPCIILDASKDPNEIYEISINILNNLFTIFRDLIK